MSLSENRERHQTVILAVLYSISDQNSHNVELKLDTHDSSLIILLATPWHFLQIYSQARYLMSVLSVNENVHPPYLMKISFSSNYPMINGHSINQLAL